MRGPQFATGDLAVQALASIQRALEALVGVDTETDVRDFVIDAETRRALGPVRAPREQLLVLQREGALEIALFVDPAALRNLDAHDPDAALDDRNLDDYCLVLEGVSHFVYTVERAKKEQPVSALELELQAEVDKFAACALKAVSRGHQGRVGALRERLFADIELLPDLDDDERSRYRTANQRAARFARSLEERYLRRGLVERMIAELRRFWRMSAAAKLDHIAALP